MKKVLLFLSALCLSLGAFADTDVPVPDWGQKRLVSMTRTKGSSTSKVIFKYDETGRLSKFSYDDNSGAFVFTYSSGKMTVTSEYRTAEMNIVDGRATTGTLDMGADGGILNISIEYDGSGHMLSAKRTSSRINMDMTGQWSGDNLTKLMNYRNGKLRDEIEISYTTTPAPPILQMLVICSDQGSPIAFNNTGLGLIMGLYMGKVPPYLISKVKVTDDGEVEEYNYSYQTNNNGDITTMTIGSYTYTLEWENNGAVSKEFIIGNLKFTKNDDGETVSVEAVDKNISGEIVIPAMVKNEGTMFTVTAIAENGFAGCKSITSVTIPDGVITIGDKAFDDCSGIKQLTVNQEQPPVVGTSSFSGIDFKKCSLIVPDGCTSNYMSANGWKDFWTIASENDIIINGITYEIKDEGTVIITSANRSAEGRYEVPSSVIIDGTEHKVTEIGANAFNGCTDMTSVTIPSEITAVGYRAFAGCVNLVEVYVKGKKPAGMKTAFSRRTVKRVVPQFEGIDFDTCVLYVPYGTVELYKAAEGWKEFKNIVGLHSEDDDPVTVTVKNYTREYGDGNPTFEYITEGEELDGEPEIECAATEASAAGTYDIIIKKGDVKNFNDTYVKGTLTITKATLKVTVNDAARELGQENPEFTLTYEGWKNGDTESVLTTKPTATTTATKDSPTGEYSIDISGGEAQNYVLTCQSGTLTVTAPNGISSITSDSTPDIYTVTGMKKEQGTALSKGVYIIDGKKAIVK